MPANVSTPLPQLDLAEGTTVTVELDDAAAIVTGLVIHGWQELPPPELPPVPVALAHEPQGR